MWTIHTPRFCNAAILDILGTLAAGFVFTDFFNITEPLMVIMIIILIFSVGVVTHVMLGINTTWNYNLGLSGKPELYRDSTC